MSVLFRWLKIIYYATLIFYQACDFYIDWKTFTALQAAGQGGLELFLFCFSCAFGSVMHPFLAAVYLYYIKHHWDCLQSPPSYKSLQHEDGMQCNRHSVWIELMFSLLELFLKDDIQTIILFRSYNSYYSLARPGLIFIVCSIASHLKQMACFVMKALRLLDSKDCPFNSEKYQCSCATKCIILCITGTMVSFALVILAILSLSLYVSP